MKRVWMLVAVFGIAMALYAGSSGAQSGGAFGSLVKSGDSDAAKKVRDAGSPSICRIDFGITDDFSDDGYYVVWDGGTTVDVYSLRLAPPPFSTKGPGSLVGNEDAGEANRAAATDHCDTTPSFCLGDADGTGNLTTGDIAYITASGSSTDCVTAPDASASPDGWSVRLMEGGGRPAGTLLFAGHLDHVSYGPEANNKDITGAEFTYTDVDNSTAASPGDLFFLAASAVSTGSTIPANSVRLTGGAAAPTTTTTTAPTTTTTTTAGPTTTTTITTTVVDHATTATQAPKGGLPSLQLVGVALALMLAVALVRWPRRDS